MSVLTAIDATRICRRWSAGLDDPAAWTIPGPPVVDRARPPEPSRPYSWWSLVRNPQALLLTGMVGTAVAADTLLRVVTPGERPVGR